MRWPVFAAHVRHASRTLRTIAVAYALVVVARGATFAAPAQATTSGPTSARTQPTNGEAIANPKSKIQNPKSAVNPQSEIRDPQLNWPMFRGDRQLTGVAACVLPEKLELKWKFKAEEAVVSSAAIVEGVVFVGSDDGFVYALNLTDGQLKWKFKAGSPVQAPPTVVDGRVFVGDQDGRMSALNAADGAELWRLATDAEILGGVNFDRGRLYFGSYDGLIRCVSMDGKPIWTFKTDSKVHATPAIVTTPGDERLLIAGCDGWLRSLGLDDGRELAKASLESYVGASPAVRGERTYMGTFGERVVCVDWKAGQEVWHYEHPVRKFPYLSSSAVSETRVVVGGRDKIIRGLDIATGKAAWEHSTSSRVEGSPVISGRNAFVGGGDGTIYALDVESGKKVWEYAGCGPMSASPAIAAGRLVIGDEDGVIMCFGGP